MLDITASMVSCPQREAVRAATLDNWSRCDWGALPRMQIDDGREADMLTRISGAWRKLLRWAAEESAAAFHLLLEDDIEPNLALRHNLERWPPLRRADGRRPFFASLYYCNQPLLWCNDRERYGIGAREGSWGAQALLMSRTTVRYLVNHWDACDIRHQDIRMAVLAGRLSRIYYHLPSLVQHRLSESTWGNRQHHATDFDLHWKA